MFLLIVNSDYGDMVSKFIQRHYANYSWIKIRTSKDDAALSKAKYILTDDLTYSPAAHQKVFWLVDHKPNNDSQICKFQKFSHILDSLKKNCTLENELSNHIRCIVVTSLVGGVGKTTIAKKLTKLLETSSKTLYLSLVQLEPHPNSNSLSDFHFEHLYEQAGFNLEKFIYKDIDNMWRLPGFNLLEDLWQSNLLEIVKGVIKILKKSQYNNLVLDLPTLSQMHMTTLFKESDVPILVQMEMRGNEEEAIAKMLNLKDLTYRSLFNKTYSISQRSFCLPTFSKVKQDEIFNFDNALARFAREVGLLNDGVTF